MGVISAPAEPLPCTRIRIHMSSFRTHMLIGAVGGLALARWVQYSQMLQLPTGVWQLGTSYVPLGLTGVGLIVGSALGCTWPDLDEPGSWPARRLKSAVALITAPLAGVVGYVLAVQGHITLRPELAVLLGIFL